MNIKVEWWLFKALSIGIMAGSTTVFMFNRHRLAWLENTILRK